MKEKNKEYVNMVEAGELKPSSSFELKKTSKGVNVSAKVYSCDSVDDIDLAMRECEKRFEHLMEKYGDSE